MSLTILLADDHQVVRQGLQVLLAREADFEVVGAAVDGQEALDLTERLQPAVLLLDLMMPGLNGLQVTQQVSQRVPKTRTVILSCHADRSYVREALRNGAAGYVLKGSDAAIIVEAIRAVSAGRRFLGPPLSEIGLQAYTDQAVCAPLDPLETLTPREREVLLLTAESLTSSQVGARLAISPRTAEAHRANLMRKLGLATQTDLIRYALLKGLLPLEK